GVLAFVLIRPALRTTAIALGVFLVAIAVYVPDSIDYYRHGHDVITSGQELGPLGGPLKLVQVAGVWLHGDYRFVPDPSWPTYALALVVLALALAGLLAAIRRRAAAVLLFAIPVLFALAVTAPASSPYIDAKLLAILSPAVVAAAGLGVTLIAARRIALPLAAVLAAALLVSDALAYRMALPAPSDRLGELTRIDERFAGRGPILVNEYEEYVKHYMRRSRGSDPYESWTAGRAELRDPSLPVAAHRYDLDQMKDAFVRRWPLIALRHSPVESRPPSNYQRVFSGRWYQVWQRKGPAPVLHVPLGKPPLDPSAPLDCGLVRRLERRGEVVAAIRPQPSVISIARPQTLPPGWYRYGRDNEMLEIHKGGRIAVFDGGPVPPGAAPGSAVQYWIRGRTTREERLQIDGGRFRLPRTEQRLSEWVAIGLEPAGTAGPHVELERPKRSLRPGDAQPDIVGPIVAVANRPTFLARGARLRLACGAPADWIDVIRR
ncbi:MAG TPA: hypothetical protein VF066_08790, partial [Thermoleophilaceae bacterium]